MNGKRAIEAMIERQKFVVLDGGLATELERSGFDLDHPLWSARLLTEDSDALYAVHRAFLQAGADCITSASYQASVTGFLNEELSDAQARRAIARSVEEAIRARDDFLADFPCDQGRAKPLVAASVGPYGAFLADGSEYRGQYRRTDSALRAFHWPRWEVLCSSGADLLACETLPCRQEALVLMDLLAVSPGAQAWFSFSCRDEAHLCDGTPLASAAADLAGSDQVVAIGVNCTAPRHIESLIKLIRQAAPSKPVVIYPNSGEAYQQGKWCGPSDGGDFGDLACRWFDAGATLIGGCCRTSPSDVRAVRDSLLARNGARE